VPPDLLVKVTGREDNMRLLSATLAALLSVSPAAHALPTQWKTEAGKTLRGLIAQGYEIKGYPRVTYRNTLTTNFILQKGASVYSCSESFTEAREERFGSRATATKQLLCDALVEPYDDNG
jgi:hypothetical protein